MADRERIIRYVRRYYERHLEFPTVRQAARALRLCQAAIEEEDESPLMLTFYNTEIPEPLGNWFVEICE